MVLILGIVFGLIINWIYHKLFRVVYIGWKAVISEYVCCLMIGAFIAVLLGF